MWKKTIFVGLLSLSGLALTGCHANHHENDNDQPAMTTDNEQNEMQVTVDQLPPEVVKTVDKHVPEATIVSAETMTWKGKMAYEIDAKSGDTVYEVRVRPNGKFISKHIDRN